MFEPLTRLARIRWAWYQIRSPHGISLRLDSVKLGWVPLVNGQDISDDIKVDCYIDPLSAVRAAYIFSVSEKFLDVETIL